MSLPGEPVEIGAPGWVAALERRTAPLGPQLWEDFQPVPEHELEEAAAVLGITWPAALAAFYREIGAGILPGGADLHPLEEVLMLVGSSLYFPLGSLSPEEWATEEEHRRFWLSRGQENPAPRRFTADKLVYEGLPLLDLLQIGLDGSCGAFFLDVQSGRDQGHIYCIDASLEVYDAGSFSELLDFLLDTGAR